MNLRTTKPGPVSGPYDSAFYDSQSSGSLASARVVLPMLWQDYQPRRVVDFGCGVGTWLHVATELGAEAILGLDGPHVPIERLEIPQGSFRPTDLSQPVTLGDQFDLAISVEVAEHLPAERAASFVSELVQAAPVVLFSAAVPHQAGTHHVNEQWPAYWAALFQEHGYAAYDPFRLKLWNDDRIEWWYRQNLLVYASPAVSFPFTQVHRPLGLVHPGRAMALHEGQGDVGIRHAAHLLTTALARRVRSGRAS